MKNYILIISISPVQSFICSAKKTSDMKAGSTILSEIVDIIIISIIDKYPGIKIIFPAKDNQFKPNRILLRLSNYTEDKVKELTIELKNKVTSLINPHQSSQIENYFKINSIAIEASDNYNEDYKKIESIFGASKNIRKYNQISSFDKLCTMCGENYANCHESKQKDQTEFLCDICILKRKKITNFPSTAEICNYHIFNKIETHDQQRLTHIINNPQLFFEENHTSKYFEENSIEIGELETIKKEKDHLNDIAKKYNLKPTKYYAIMSFDGDNMGRWLSGDYLRDLNTLEEFQIKLSEKIGEFAKVVKDYLVQPRGCIIYAGGEDFIGFININFLYETLIYIRQKFKEIINDPLTKFFSFPNLEITFTAGVVITHYKYDLQTSMYHARELEKDVKKIYSDKNGLGISILKSDKTQSILKWDDNYNSIQSSLKILEFLKELFSSTFIFKLYEEFKLYYHTNSLSPQINIEYINWEIKRLVERSYKVSRSSNDYNVNDIINMAKYVSYLLERSSTNYSLNNFINTLKVIDFISREIYYETKN